MNYNQFYRKKDQYKRDLKPFEKVNAQRIGMSFAKSLFAGMAAGLLLVLILKIFM